MNVGNRLAVNRNGSIRDGNLYFFCWFSLLAALIVFMSYLSESRNLGFGSLFSWPVLCLTSFVVMASAIDMWREYGDDGCQDGTNTFCKRTRFAVILGGVCGFFCLLWTFASSRFPGTVDSLFRILVCVPWAAAVAVVTFGGSKAPGHEVGSLYFFTWASFGIAFVMATDAALGLMAERPSSQPSTKKRPRDVEPSS